MKRRHWTDAEIEELMSIAGEHGSRVDLHGEETELAAFAVSIGRTVRACTMKRWHLRRAERGGPKHRRPD